jgi:hypothetical protein
MSFLNENSFPLRKARNHTLYVKMKLLPLKIIVNKENTELELKDQDVWVQILPTLAL